MLKKATNTPEISTFSFEPNDKVSISIRALLINEEPWFVAKEICEALGYNNGPHAVREHTDPNQRNTIVIRDSIRGNPRKSISSEGGLYALILGSQLLNVKEFKQWVTDKVLPSIRKHGGYIQGQETGQLSDAELLAKAVLVAQRVNEELSQKNAMLTEDLTRKQFVIEEMHDQVGALAEDNAALEAVKAEMEPLFEGFQHFLSLDGTYNKEAVAKILGFPSAIMLNRWLAYVGIQSARKYWKNGREYIKYWYLRSQWVKRHDLFKTKTSEDVVRGTQVHIRATQRIS